MQLSRNKAAKLTVTQTLTLGAQSSINANGTSVPVAEVANLAGITATAAEVNRSADASARIVTSTATSLNLTVTQHAEKIVLINTNSTVANTFTLPLATGSGVKMTLINNIAQTQGSVVIAANGTTNVIAGMALVVNSTGTTTPVTFLTTATSDKVTFNLTTTGGLGGDMVEAWDTATSVWTVRVFCNGSGSLATPFAAT